jgi:hypothetical protein
MLKNVNIVMRLGDSKSLYMLTVQSLTDVVVGCC